ncbi:hypothetical protein [Actinomadura sp. 21ATH]|uniref:hypothetical protein n=1 Tax=Actinomadura sp. 21ATH TaxID=1735444 RepID=UPI0035C04546
MTTKKTTLGAPPAPVPLERQVELLQADLARTRMQCGQSIVYLMRQLVRVRMAWYAAARGRREVRAALRSLRGGMDQTVDICSITVEELADRAGAESERADELGIRLIDTERALAAAERRAEQAETKGARYIKRIHELARDVRLARGETDVYKRSWSGVRRDRDRLAVRLEEVRDERDRLAEQTGQDQQTAGAPRTTGSCRSIETAIAGWESGDLAPHDALTAIRDQLRGTGGTGAG